MKTCTQYILGLMMLVLMSMSAAAEPAKSDTVARLLQVSGAAAMMDGAYAQMDAMQKQLIASMNISADKKQAVQRFSERYAVLVQEELSWDKIKKPLIDIYSKVYTEDEVKTIIDFYESPVGQKVVQKNPELMQASMQLMQQMMMDLMPKIQELHKQLEVELGSGQ